MTPIILLALAALADVLTTRAVIRAGGREMNPIYDHRPTWPKLLITHALPVAVAAWMHADPEIRAIAYFGALFFGAVSVHNWWVLRKMKKA